LGRGAVGEVFKAFDPDLGREVAIKVIAQSGAGDLVQERFRREVRLAAHLKHPNIITVFDVGLDRQPPFVVTELLGGGTPKDHLEQGATPWEEALALLEPICEALGYAHEAGIVHRDVKPGNIMFADDASRAIKLADFGLAQRQDDDRLTQSGGIVGTIAYMSPEQANGEAVDARTDIFSLGLILFEAIAGLNPLRGETTSQTLLNAISYEPVDLSDVENKVPDQVLALLTQALARERRHRYRSCQQFGQNIASCLSSREPPPEARPAATPDIPTAAPESDATVQIENARGLSLPPNAQEILQGCLASIGAFPSARSWPGGSAAAAPCRQTHKKRSHAGVARRDKNGPTTPY
jgi:serine/threonine-protein kinase